MKTLNEKLLKAIASEPVPVRAANECEKVCDDFAEKFADWIIINRVHIAGTNQIWYELYPGTNNIKDSKATAELVQIFKEEVYNKQINP